MAISRNVEIAMGRVEGAKSRLEAAKANKDTAKRNGSYKTALKNYNIGGAKYGNVYDYNVWAAQEDLKRQKELLAEEKKRK